MKNIEASKIIMIQPALPNYRMDFFERLYKNYGDLFSVYASSQIELGKLDRIDNRPPWSVALRPIRKFFGKFEWQPGVLGVSIKRRDIVVIGGSPWALTTYILMAKARMLGAKVVWWGQLWSFSSTSNRAAVRQRLMMFADAIVFYTDDEVLGFKNKIGNAYQGLIKALNNGLDVGEISRLRSDYDSRKRKRDIIFIGRVTEKSELALLIQSLAVDGCNSYTLDVIGDGDIDSHRQLAISLGVAERIFWHGAIIDERKIAIIANESKIFAYPGAVGLSIVHAMAYGLPVLIHNEKKKHGPENVILKNDINGYWFERASIIDLAEKIRYLLKDENNLNRLSVGAIESTRYTFNTHDMANRFIEVVKILNN